MEITWTRTKTIVTVSVLALLALGVAVKKIYFPTVDEKYFQLDYQRLQHAPANIFILRPTHFAESRRTGYMSASASYEPGKYLPRLLGRNVTLAQIIAAAYQCPQSRVVLPWDAPTNHFDFLDTLSKQPAERLQAAVKRKFGCVAGWKDHETEVWQLKVQTPDAPGLHASSADRGNVQFKNGRIYFTHMAVGQLSGLLESALKKPVQDQTGLTGFYDFSVAWSWRGSNAMDVQAVKNALAELGLTLDDDTGLMQMMVVERVR